MVTLRDVIDLRNGQYHSVAVIKKNKVKYYVPVDQYQGGMA